MEDNPGDVTAEAEANMMSMEREVTIFNLINEFVVNYVGCYLGYGNEIRVTRRHA